MMKVAFPFPEDRIYAEKHTQEAQFSLDRRAKVVMLND